MVVVRDKRRRPYRRGRRRWRRITASWLDYLGVDEDGDEAEKLAVFDSSGVVSIDGVERRPAVLGHGHGAVRIRVRAWGKSEGEREQRVVGCSFILLGGGQGARGARGGNGGRGHGASDLTVAPGRRREEERLTGGSPLSGFSPFPVFQKFQQDFGI